MRNENSLRSFSVNEKEKNKFKFVKHFIMVA